MAKILLHSRFHPSIGGLETVARLLADHWIQLGHELVVATDVTSDAVSDSGYPILYRPGPFKWINAFRWCDVYLQFNVCLKALWPRLLIRRPLVFSHHGWYSRVRTERRDVRERVKLVIAREHENIFASQAICKSLELPGYVIANPFDNSTFRRLDEARHRDLVFLGRLVSDKGVHVLLEALRTLAGRSSFPTLTVIGDGPDRAMLESQAASLSLSGQIVFAGALPPPKVALMLNRHKILVVPSLWREPFGVVALEAAACGCVPLGSDAGGLPEAIGESGMTFKRGDSSDLARKIELLLNSPDVLANFRVASKKHLLKHDPRDVALRYANVLTSRVHQSKRTR